MSLISDTILAHLPSKRKQTPSGWISFNAPCCQDQRQRGGLIFNQGDAVSYHCFNCGFKASWQPGRNLTQKMRKFMRDLNMSDDIINQLGLEAMRLKDSETAEVRSIVPTFDERVLPPDSKTLQSWNNWGELGGGDTIPKGVIDVAYYLMDRGIEFDQYPFYYCPKVGFSNRVIIPFIYNGKIVGYTARAIGDAKPKYISEQQPGYVFNLDNQNNDRKFVIVCEGPLDALSIDGCALLGSEIKDSQNWLLKQLGKEIVLVPDRDHEGPKTVEQAIEFGWSVSMPEWPAGVKDVNDALIKLGKLSTLYLITQAKESNSLKIQLRAKRWFKHEETN
jgi:hypothetical protein